MLKEETTPMEYSWLFPVVMIALCLLMMGSGMRSGCR
jgi:hypothetical protein